ncbi:SRPBCC family protein [Pseudonocardia bannensis]|uniref:ATPase n=1 Tax=Pseudonocardia bannensis TaxID=630973 RepID=A0A848DJN9_9PSEU|nr:SRPBCC family protein [Pseudonocardia bannensis]NMH92691.1 ATPase [Pseudonocardia bannensis]
MSIQTVAPVRHSVEVAAPLPVAFEVFTARFASWWPTSHHIAPQPYVDAVIEPRAGGRWYERDAEGRECDWGRVLAWEPPHRLVLSWAISPQFEAEPDPARASEVEVRFTAVGDSHTRVELEHRHFERHGDGGEQMRAVVGSEGGWGGILVSFAAQARTAT